MLNTYWREKCARIEERLDQLLPGGHIYPPTIHQSMRYSTLAGGKRLRPVLVVAAAEAVGGRAEDVLDVACAIEMIHTYSLIHDDLPAMDNDDYRRGKLTNHKVFGDGVAILAGDALLTYAFDVMTKAKITDSTLLLKVIQEIAEAVGTMGMIGGQVVDLESEGKQIDHATLEYIHRAKTGALFRASLRAGAILAGANDKQLACLTEYAELFGLVFQITDDILDVVGDEQKIGKPVGSDIKNQKATYPSLFTLPVAQQMAEDTIAKALQCLDISGLESQFLCELVQYLATREQ
jgi:geranylgeranyl diphosphate synthase, type II